MHFLSLFAKNVVPLHPQTGSERCFSAFFPCELRKVAQLVAHYVRDVGVGRSSRLFPTKNVIRRWNTTNYHVFAIIKGTKESHDVERALGAW